MVPDSGVPQRLPSTLVGQPLPKTPIDAAPSPDEIVDQTFKLKRRGFDRQEVQSYLATIAASLQDAQQREADMRSRLAKAVRRADAAERQARAAELRSPSPHDEADSVLVAAQLSAEQRIAAAQQSAQQLLENAKADADRMRADAEALVADRRAEVNAECEQLIAAGHEQAEVIVTQARIEGQAATLRAADLLQHACDHSDALVREAQEARGQILEDMDRRRRHARAQVERLRVGRDRLLRSYDVVRRTLDESTSELRGSLREAKLRGDNAARTVSAEPLATREQLEDELRDAKLIGRLQPAGESLPDGVIRSRALPRRLEPVGVEDVVDLRAEAPVNQGEPARTSAAVSAGPKAPASAPLLSPTPADEVADRDDPIAAMMRAVEAKHGRVPPEEPEPLDPELAELEDDNLNVVVPSDEIEAVEAMPVAHEASTNLEADPVAPLDGIEAQRDAVIADAAKQFEQQLKQALAAEQDELLAGLLAADQATVEVASLVGDIDRQVNRYVAAINQIAADTYGAGAALVDATALEGHLPAGAVEELLAVDVVMPIRERLASLDELDADTATTHVDHVRELYLQRTTDHVGLAASRLANLLCVAGLCDALPDEAEVPWKTSTP